MPSEPPKKLVVDANALISGSLWGGTPGRLMAALFRKKFTLVLSSEMLAEFHSVLNRAKFAVRLAKNFATPKSLTLCLARRAEFVRPSDLARPPELRDPKDLIVLATAVSAQADAIVTGDNDLLTLHAFRGIPIITVQDALQLLGIP